MSDKLQLVVAIPKDSFRQNIDKLKFVGP